jgi:hypothetical protein
MRLIYPILLTVLLLNACHKGQSPAEKTGHQNEHSLATELAAFYDISSLPRYIDGSVCAQVSSYDTTGNNDDGFSGRYSFIRRNADSSLVIFDLKGNGVINRIWTPTPTQDTLDFYFGNDVRPSFSIQYADLFSGNKYPFVGPLCGSQLGGNYCYLPIPFDKSCKIVCRGRKMQFHQIQYRLYEKGAVVRNFSPDLDGEERMALEKIALLWNNEKRKITDFYSVKPESSFKSVRIKPGEIIPVFEDFQGGRILGFEIDPVDVIEGDEKNIDLKITWDDEKNPAIYCPVADFFGYAFGSASMQSLLLGSRDSVNYCYFPMPFDKQARMELVYRRTETIIQSPLRISVRVWYSAEKRRRDKEGKFYAYWNKNIITIPGQPHVFLNVNGRGHYVGTILQAQGLRAGMTYFFEGDDSASIDGKFRIHGTGSEDYFNGGWYAMMDRWDGRLSLPLHGALDYSIPYCRTGGYRLYISDKLSFEKHFFNSIEHGPAGNMFPADYTSLGLYYSNSSPEKITEPTRQLTRVFIPDTLVVYPQLMDYNLFGDMDVKTSWKYGTGGESYLFTPGNDSWLRISLSDLPYGDYSLYLDIMREPFGCNFSLWQRQTRISRWIPTNGPGEERVMHLFACHMQISDYNKTLTFRFRIDQQKTSLLLNRIVLVRE